MKELLLRLSFRSIINQMILTSTQTSTGIASTQHPHFVGLAQLRSLLAHEDVASDSVKSDAVLDMIAVLLRQGSARSAVEAFCRMKKVCGSVCYMAQFRLRNWLEKQVMVCTGNAGWQPLELGFSDFRRLLQAFRRREWEWQETAGSWQDIEVVFAWSGVPEVMEQTVLEEEQVAA
jgi:hypothetical protein